MTPRVRPAILAAVLLVSAGTARASCWPFLDFGQLTEGCAGGSAYCYVISPGVNTPDSIAARFWSLTTGQPAIGAGDDNGAWEDEEGWLVPEGPGAYLAGTWSASTEIDGCIDGRIPPGKSAEVMVVALSDQDHYGAWGYFAIASVSRVTPGWPAFDFARGIARDLVLSDIPPPSGLWATPYGARRWQVTIFPPNESRIASGVFGDGTAGFAEVVRGYRVYRKDTALYGAPPTDRSRSSWTPVSGAVPLTGSVTFEIDCSSRDFDTHLAVSLVFDGGFETGHVSESRVLRLCNWFCPVEFLVDVDGDGFYLENEFGCPMDCDDSDEHTYPGAPEVNDGRDNQCPNNRGYGIVDEISGSAGFLSSSDKTALTWRRQAGATLYELARSDRPEFTSACMTWTTPSTTFADPDAPDSEHVFYYLVRTLAPFLGSWGQDSSGAERMGVCP